MSELLSSLVLWAQSTTKYYIRPKNKTSIHLLVSYSAHKSFKLQNSLKNTKISLNTNIKQNTYAQTSNTFFFLNSPFHIAPVNKTK